MGNLIKIRNISLIAVVFTGLIAFSGCASVKFYSDPGLEKQTGLRYYTLKPYLLVEYQAEKDNTVKTSVVYLPDLENPQYIVIKPGIGATDLKMAFTNSALTSYGISTESEYPELFESIASMLSKSAYAAQGFTGQEPGELDVSGTYFRLYEILPGRDGTIMKEIIPVLNAR